MTAMAAKLSSKPVIREFIRSFNPLKVEITVLCLATRTVNEVFFPEPAVSDSGALHNLALAVT
jgi:hypothetical protein